jgi:hypothetical protein
VPVVAVVAAAVAAGAIFEVVEEADIILALALEAYPSACPFVRSCVEVEEESQVGMHLVVELSSLAVAVGVVVVLFGVEAVQMLVRRLS